MHSKALKDLDFERVIFSLSKSLSTHSGKRYLQSIKPLSDSKRSFHEKALIDIEKLRKKGVILPLYDFEGIEKTIEKIRVGSKLLPREFIGVLDFLQNYVKLYEVLYHSVIREQLPSPEIIKYVIRKLKRTIGENGYIKDDASERLRNLIEKKQRIEEKLKKVLADLLEDYYKKGMLREKFYTIKNYRYVFPFKTEVFPKGIVQSYSNSDKTIYVEPYEIVDIQNELVKLGDEKKEEEERIIRELLQVLSENYETIKEIYERIGWIDFLNAIAIYREEFGAVFVKESDALYVENLRHPLLVEVKGYDNVVPLSIERFDKKGLFISGPNAGGKTVVLKSIGLIALSYLYGLPIIADKVEIFKLDSVYTLGFENEQDIIKGKSTFSAMLEEVKHIIDKAAEGSIVLFDEPFSLTDPEEGNALAEAIVLYLIQRGVRVFLTTHMWGLKFFAEEHPDICNATMLFDSTTGKPLYRFKIGRLGKSYAIETAKNSGLPSEILDYAKKRLSKGQGRVIELISRLEAEESELITKLERLSKKEKEIAEKEERLKKHGKRLIMAEYERVQRELRELLRELHRESRLKDKIKKVQMAKKYVEDQKEKIDLYDKPANTPKVGKNYRIKPTGIIATLIELRKKTAIVQVGKAKIEISKDNLFEI